MYLETAVRDGFVIRGEAYYLEMWRDFIEAEVAQPLIAEIDGQPIAAVIVYQYGHSAMYLYGMSTGKHRDRMPNYLLQWEAIRWAKSRSCTIYDFWGAPEYFGEQDPLWGLYRFKSGFGGEIVQWIGARDRVLQRRRYSLYASLLPGMLSAARWIWRRNPVRWTN